MARIKQLYELAYAAQEFFFLSLAGFSCEFRRPPSKITKRERQRQREKERGGKGEERRKNERWEEKRNGTENGDAYAM